jgi:hypothetical protein
VVLLSVLLFLVACAIPAIDLEHYAPDDMIHGPQLGVVTFALGCLGLGLSVLSLVENPRLDHLFGFLFYLTWVANPIFLVGCVQLRREKYRGAILAGSLALLLCGWYLVNACHLGPYPIRAHSLAGSFIWIASMAVMTAGAVIVRARTRWTPKPSPQC